MIDQSNVLNNLLATFVYYNFDEIDFCRLKVCGTFKYLSLL